ncbi:MAG: glutaredoxin family protein [Acidobacteria bacterium]|nr:glutaredoxin family protein [Acidobacteriota bacterium]
MSHESSGKARVVIYTRPGCHLCDAAKAQIARARCDELFTLEEVDVDSDPGLARRYGHDVPVVTINGAHAFKHRLTAEDFKRELRRAFDSR